MYTRLHEKNTKEEYRNVLYDTIAIVSENVATTGAEIWERILAQLKDIDENIVHGKTKMEWDEIFERYELGTLAVNNFDESDEMYGRLCDIFGGAVEYYDAPEK